MDSFADASLAVRCLHVSGGQDESLHSLPTVNRGTVDLTPERASKPAALNTVVNTWLKTELFFFLFFFS